MSSMYQYLSEQVRLRGLAAPGDIASFAQGERERYWQQLLAMNLGEADRLNALQNFDSACRRLVAERQTPPPAPTHAPAPKSRSAGRDVILVLIGALLAVPATLAANYLTNLWLPSTTKVDVQSVGVQQLKAQEQFFYFQRSKLADARRDGAIDVIYAMGTDPSGFKCSVKVSIPQMIEHVAFEKGCRRIRYRLVDPRRMFAKPTDFGATFNMPGPALVFNVEITADNGQLWVGSESVGWNLLDL